MSVSSVDIQIKRKTHALVQQALSNEKLSYNKIVSQICCAEGQNSSEDYIGHVFVYVYYDR